MRPVILLTVLYLACMGIMIHCVFNGIDLKATPILPMALLWAINEYAKGWRRTHEQV